MAGVGRARDRPGGRRRGWRGPRRPEISGVASALPGGAAPRRADFVAARAGEQAHAAATQTAVPWGSPGHTFAQVPQWSVSERRSTQKPPQSVSSAGHALPSATMGGAASPSVMPPASGVGGSRPVVPGRDPWGHVTRAVLRGTRRRSRPRRSPRTRRRAPDGPLTAPARRNKPLGLAPDVLGAPLSSSVTLLATSLTPRRSSQFFSFGSLPRPSAARLL